MKELISLRQFRSLIILSGYFMASKSCITFFFLYLTIVSSFGQKTKPEAEVTIDGNTKLADKYAPFDQWFILNIPIDSAIRVSEIRKDNVVIFELGRGNAYNNYQEAISSLPIRFLSFTKTKEKYNTLKVLARPLRPGGNYAFLVGFSFNSTVTALHEFNDVIEQGASDTAKKIRFDRILKSINDFNAPALEVLRVGLESPDSEIDLRIVNQNAYEGFYRDSIKVDLVRLRDVFTKADQLPANLKAFQDALKECSICEFVMKCNCENSFIIEELKLSLQKLLPVVCQFKDLKEVDIRAIADSQTSLDSLVNGLMHVNVSFRTTKALQTNLAKNLEWFTTIKRLLNESTLRSFVSDSCRSLLITSIDSIIANLTARQRDAKNLYSTINDRLVRNVNRGIRINNQIFRFPFFSLSAVNAQNPTIKASAGNYFIPEIGVATMVSNETSGDPTVFVRPYFGINISFKPINKEIRFKDIRTTRYKRVGGTKQLTTTGPTAWHHLSVTLGVTRHSISTNHPEIDDVLKDMCVVSGLNYRITRAFRVGGGVVWYRRDNPNPLLSDQVVVMPNITVSLDVDVVNWANSVTDFFLK